jgi:hypothetical protein
LGSRPIYPSEEAARYGFQEFKLKGGVLAYAEDLCGAEGSHSNNQFDVALAMFTQPAPAQARRPALVRSL